MHAAHCEIDFDFELKMKASKAFKVCVHRALGNVKLRRERQSEIAGSKEKERHVSRHWGEGKSSQFVDRKEDSKSAKRGKLKSLFIHRNSFILSPCELISCLRYWKIILPLLLQSYICWWFDGRGLLFFPRFCIATCCGEQRHTHNYRFIDLPKIDFSIMLLCVRSHSSAFCSLINIASFCSACSLFYSFCLSRFFLAIMKPLIVIASMLWLPLAENTASPRICGVWHGKRLVVEKLKEY